MNGVRGPDPRPIAERFWPKVNVNGPGGCWLWTASKNIAGYGQMMTGSNVDGTRRPRGVHRVAYELLIGPIPEGMELDHLCRVPACVNPAHLEPVTSRENTLRGVGIAPRNAAKTECPKGHAYTPENTVIRPNGTRTCRECICARHRAYYQRKKAEREQR